MPTQKFINEVLSAAIDGFESQKRRIEAQIAELRAILSPGPAEPAATPEAPTKKRKVSAAARRKMALAQKARWAKIRGESEPVITEPVKPKRRISKEGLARIIAATKKRWALKRAASAKSEIAVAKNAAVKRPLRRNRR